MRIDGWTKFLTKEFLLTFANFFMGNRLSRVSIEALFTVVTMTSSRVVAASNTQSAAGAGQLVDLHVEAASASVLIAVAC